MEILFADPKLQKLCNNKRRLQKKHGRRRTRKILLRLTHLQAAETLEEMSHFPGRCHELSGDRAGRFALDLDHPYRLVFEPYHDPIPRKADGGINRTAVTAVLIIALEDYHE